MTNTDKPVGEMVLIGRTAYQIYSHIYRGVVQYRAKIGKPWLNKETGVTAILPFMQDDSTRDYSQAVLQAAQQLEQLQIAGFRQQVHHRAASISPMDPVVEEEFRTEPSLKLKLASG